MVPDVEKFRLRRFVEKLNNIGEVEIVDNTVNLVDIADIIQNSPKVVWFKNAGSKGLELVANVNGSRKRLAMAMNTSEENFMAEYERRLGNPQPLVEISEDEAPVQEIRLQGEKADLAMLPFYLQHQLDGGPYISAGIDYSIDPLTGKTNVGCRRLSLRNSQEAGTNLTAPSDLKRIYNETISRGNKLDVNFAIGSHPLDYLAAGMKIPTDELNLVSTLRGEAVPIVRGISNQVPVPADAEMIIEGYLDELGYVEPDGPYGEYVGYYGPMHQDPVFHVTAITMRKDALHQTLLHGAGPQIHRAESVHLMSVGLEAKAKQLLIAANIIVADVYVPPGSAEGQHLRVSISQKHPEDPKKAISVLIEKMFVSKHVFVVDDDIDIRNEHQWEWAFVSRFQATKDMIAYPKMRGMPMDPSLEKSSLGTKAGFDLTLPIRRRNELMLKVATAPIIRSAPLYQTVAQALQSSGPMFFSEILEGLGSCDGREIALELDKIRRKGNLMRDKDGRYLLGKATKGTTGLFGPQHDDPNDGTN